MRRIHERSEGNPFFTEELVAAGGHEGDAGRLPPSLRDILLGRLAGLSDEAQRVLRIAAIGGQLTDDSLLSDATGWPPDQIDEAVREAIARQVLAVDTRSGTYRFRHALLAEVVDAELLPGSVGGSTSRSRPGRPALAPVASCADHRAVLALHWYAAGRLRDALVASIAASRAAGAVYAHADALRQAGRAVDLWDRVPDAAEATGMPKVDVFALAADAATSAGQTSRAVEALANDPRRAGRGERPNPGRSCPVQACLQPPGGRQPGSLEEHLAAAALIPAEPPTVERARVLGGLASAFMPTGHYRESRELCEEAIATLQAAGSHDGGARLLTIWAWTSSGRRRRGRPRSSPGRGPPGP